MILARSDGERAVRVARLSSALGMVGVGTYSLSNSDVIAPTIAELVAIIVCGFGWLYLTLDPRPSRARGTLVFLIVNATIIAALWASQERFVAANIPWVPFRPNRLGAITVAALAPPVMWVGLLVIAGFSGAAIVQWQLWDASVHERMPYGEPYGTLAFTGFAIVLLIHRLRAANIEREVIRIHAEAAAYERLARAIVAIRDLANTPMQTLTNTVALLRGRGEHEHADRIARALERLKQLEQLTRPYERQLRWRTGDEAWDPWQILKHR